MPASKFKPSTSPRVATSLPLLVSKFVKSNQLTYFHSIADDVADDEDGETVINIVEAHKLNELTLSKKDTMAMIKALLKKIVQHLKDNGNEERVKPFQVGATEMIKFIMGKFDEMQIFAG